MHPHHYHSHTQNHLQNQAPTPQMGSARIEDLRLMLDFSAQHYYITFILLLFVVSALTKKSFVDILFNGYIKDLMKYLFTKKKDKDEL